MGGLGLAKQHQNHHIVCWYPIWYIYTMPTKKMKKITLELPVDVLARALESSGQGISGTVRQALELLSARVAYEKLRALRGKVKFSVDLKTLRDDS